MKGQKLENKGYGELDGERARGLGGQIMQNLVGCD